VPPVTAASVAVVLALVLALLPVWKPSTVGCLGLKAFVERGGSDFGTTSVDGTGFKAEDLFPETTPRLTDAVTTPSD